MTTIREATAADLAGVVLMAQHFIDSAPYGASIPNDVEHCERVVAQLLSLGVVLVADCDGMLVGMLAGAVYPHFLTGRQTASESFWWVEPDARGKTLADDLLAAFTAWALNRGAVVLELGSRHKVLDRFYERRGFTAVERVFQKELSR